MDCAHLTAYVRSFSKVLILITGSLRVRGMCGLEARFVEYIHGLIFQHVF
jgi:hypothetical protein